LHVMARTCPRRREREFGSSRFMLLDDQCLNQVLSPQNILIYLFNHLFLYYRFI